MKKGLAPSFQYTVSIPAELAESLWAEGATFHWRASGPDLLLERTPRHKDVLPFKWTPEMDARVMNKPVGMKDADLALELGVSKSAVPGRRYALRAAETYGLESSKRWTPEREEVIRFGLYSDIETAAMLGISVSAMRNRRGVLRKLGEMP